VSTATLSELLGARNESLYARPAHEPALTLLIRRLRRIDLSPARRALLALLLVITKHGLVLSGCTALIIAASTLSVTATWIMVAISMFFLEARRR
jgi:uncharacterized membrane protein YhaH (DUF805 family)